jgi:hypothetical protein
MPLPQLLNEDACEAAEAEAGMASAATAVPMMMSLRDLRN